MKNKWAWLKYAAPDNRSPNPYRGLAHVSHPMNIVDSSTYYVEDPLTGNPFSENPLIRGIIHPLWFCGIGCDTTNNMNVYLI